MDGQAGGGATKYSILNRWTYETLPKNCPFNCILNTQLSSQINKIKIPNHFRAGWAMIGLELKCDLETKFLTSKVRFGLMEVVYLDKEKRGRGDHN